ncbi:unannotated protein [freshwater metagenome]|uniref:Unannotated protein n=1 Tax=freshwater metagenome TaxID=449393 RepID=A0A6J6Q4Y7_9ZZZZ
MEAITKPDIAIAVEANQIALSRSRRNIQPTIPAETGMQPTVIRAAVATPVRSTEAKKKAW